jgi:adenine-specific DNA-methyltransferase
MLHDVETNVAKSVFTDYEDGETQTKSMFGKAGLFLAPKHTKFVSRFILQGSRADSVVLDCFGGSGSTAHAVLELNRAPESRRKFITAEVNKYFDTLIIPRLVKAGSAVEWIDGKAKELNGSGLFMRIQHLEQYDDTLESLDPEVEGGEAPLPFDDPVFAMRYRLDKDLRNLYCGVDRFASPFGYQLRSAAEGGEPRSRDVDLIESVAYLLGMTIRRMYRELHGVVICGRNPRGESVSVIFRECSIEDSAAWVAEKVRNHPADRIYVNEPSELAFEGCERLESIEAVFALQFARP